MNFPEPPRGIRAIPWRLPIWFFRLGLGWIFGGRFLLLSHTGRKTGKNRQAVLEIIHHSIENQTYTVASGFGPKSDWYRNVIANPDVNIQVGFKRMKAIAHQLDPDQAEPVFLEYVDQYPQSIRFLTMSPGYELEHTTEGYKAFSRQIPIIQLTVNRDNR